MSLDPVSSSNPSNFDLDIIAKVIQHTLLSPIFAIFVPLTVMSQGYKHGSHQLAWSCWYAGGVVAIGVLNHMARLYNNQSSWFLKPERVDWGEQIVVVTGGASGVGALLAETLALRNVTVVVLDIAPVTTENSNIVSYICDISSPTEVRAAAAKIREEIGDPTILVNNAGVVNGRLILDLSEEEIQRTFNVNTLSHYWTIKAFLPAMIEKGSGHIVTMGSVLGMVGCAQMTDYCASKAALIGMHDSLRFELKNRYKTPSIRTTLVLPGHIATPLFSQVQFNPSRLFHFLAPSLQPHMVVKAIIAALDDQESRVIRLPVYTHTARLMGSGSALIPGWVRDVAQWWSGADWSMSAYAARKGEVGGDGKGQKAVEAI